LHLLATRPGGYAAGDGVVDLGQSPADVVILSAADTDLALLADACERLPNLGFSLRLASLLSLRSNASVDLYFERVLESARVVVVAMMGGTSYWPYGVERLVERARHPEPHPLELVLVPGDDTSDPELMRLCTAAPADCHQIWRYLREGGPNNAGALLQLLGTRFFGARAAPSEARPLPRALVYHPAVGVSSLEHWQSEWQATWPVIAMFFYRAHFAAGNLAAFDGLIETLREHELNPLPIAVASLKEAACRAAAEELMRRAGAELVLNTTGFALTGPERDDVRSYSLGLDRPVLQVMLSGGNVADWRAGAHGLSPQDLAMSVVLPETDGRIITRAVSWKGLRRRSTRTEIDVIEYQLDAERAAFVAKLAAAWVRLARLGSAERRVALILANYPAQAGRLGNGVGLDTPASTLAILRALAAAGYDVAELPGDGGELIRLLQTQVTNELAVIDTKPCQQSLALADYLEFSSHLPRELVDTIDRRWGPAERDPFCRDGRLMISGVQFGATFVGIQPARAYAEDTAGTYHDPDLVPPHAYLAFYCWLRQSYRAHAIVHVGKHGNLEWLPGKSVALSRSCWPDAVLGPTPHLYPFIVNDPGEGSQAKRRAQAVIIDHLVPPLTRAETYGALRDLERLVDEFYQALALDPARAQLLRREILASARSANLDREVGKAALRRASNAADADDALLVSIDAYLCELKELQIRDGLHVFGRSPAGAQRLDTLLALSRAPARAGVGKDAGLVRALSRALFAEPPASAADPLELDPAAPWDGPRPELLMRVSEDPWRSAGDTRERLELLARRVLAGESEVPEGVGPVVERILGEVAPALDACGEREMAGLLAGLDGRFVEPGPSGAPTRGRLDVLPTGRNFYSIDVRAVPTAAAYRLAVRAAERLVQRHVQDHGEYPRSVGLSLWGTATMRTGGDDVAQALALLGVRPVWAEGSARVVDTEVLPRSALRRPRVDVVLRISGFFRDAFPELIRLLDAAVCAVADLDEPEDVNPLRARVQADEGLLLARGVPATEAACKARLRIFGSKPGAYGAGLGALIEQGKWRDRADLAEAYLEFGCYAYRAADASSAEQELLRTRLSGVQAVLQNQDNREHDLLDSDDYYQFQGGMSAAVEQIRGERPALYHGDHSDPEAPRVRSLSEELGRVIRGRVVNPKWIAGARRHGYKGAAEMAATVDFIFGYDAATDIVEDYQYALLSDAYLFDPENAAFLREHNPDALRGMSERLLEAMSRGMWRQPGARRARLEELLLDAEESA